MNLCVFISPRYFSFYDDEYGYICFNDNGDHATHDTQVAANLRTSLWTACSTMMDPGGANHLRIYACTCGSYAGKYCTANVGRTGDHP